MTREEEKYKTKQERDIKKPEIKPRDKLLIDMKFTLEILSNQVYSSNTPIKSAHLHWIKFNLMIWITS